MNIIYFTYFVQLFRSFSMSLNNEISDITSMVGQSLWRMTIYDEKCQKFISESVFYADGASNAQVNFE